MSKTTTTTVVEEFTMSATQLREVLKLPEDTEISFQIYWSNVEIELNDTDYVLHVSVKTVSRKVEP